MITRRQGREWALQMLCQLDLNPPDRLDDAVDGFWEQQKEIERDLLGDDDHRTRVVFTSDDDRTVQSLVKIRAFAEARVRGVMAVRDTLDKTLEPFLENWSLYRLGTVERNVLRLGIWELENCEDIPVPIVINEAVDLAKFFSETRSGRFVNGILDKFAKKRMAEPKTFTP